MEVTTKVKRVVKTGHGCTGRFSLKNKLLQMIRDILPQHHFARGVSILAGGTLGSQLLTVAATPIITRLYSPEDFGVLAVYGGLLAIFGVLSTMRYSLAIPLPDEDNESVNIIALCILLLTGTTLLCSLIILFFARPISVSLGVPNIQPYLWLLPIGILSTGLFQVFNYWSIRKKTFSMIAASSLKQSVATIVIRLGASSFGAVSLLISQVTGQIISSYSLARPVLNQSIFKEVKWSKVKEVAMRHRKFPLFSTSASLFSITGMQLPALMLAS